MKIYINHLLCIMPKRECYNRGSHFNLFYMQIKHWKWKNTPKVVQIAVASGYNT
jgi:hypothetical protein